MAGLRGRVAPMVGDNGHAENTDIITKAANLWNQLYSCFPRLALVQVPDYSALMFHCHTHTPMLVGCLFALSSSGDFSYDV